MGERAADLAGTDQRNLGTRHVGKNLGWGTAESPAKRVIDRFRPAVQVAAFCFSGLYQACRRPRGNGMAVRQGEISLRAHLDQTRGPPLQLVPPQTFV